MLKVTESGQSKFSWWPDWVGSDVAIIASGPSMKDIDVSCINGRCKVIAIKKTIEKCEWADAVYGCDAPWWRSVQGLPKFNGIKICYRDNALDGYPDIRRINMNKDSDELLLDEPAMIGSGGNSAFQALNLAVQFGARRILLVGCDMTDRPGAHWYGRNNWMNAGNPSAHNFTRWVKAFFKIVPKLNEIGVDVINSSPYGALKAFPCRSVPDVLRAWE